VIDERRKGVNPTTLSTTLLPCGLARPGRGRPFFTTRVEFAYDGGGAGKGGVGTAFVNGKNVEIESMPLGINRVLHASNCRKMSALQRTVTN
jgi:hypothetical protein